MDEFDYIKLQCGKDIFIQNKDGTFYCNIKDWKKFLTRLMDIHGDIPFPKACAEAVIRYHQNLKLKGENDG